MTIDFLVDAPIKGQPRPRACKAGNHIRLYDPECSVNYKNLVKECCLRALEEAGIPYPVHLSDQGFTVHIDANFAIPKSFSKKKREMANGGAIKVTKKPDADNIGKIICDSLNDVLWYDDSQVTSLSINKQYGEKSTDYVHVMVEWTE